MITAILYCCQRTAWVAVATGIHSGCIVLNRCSICSLRFLARSCVECGSGVESLTAVVAIVHFKHYCETSYFSCILISSLRSVETWVHFNLTFSQCSRIYQMFCVQTKFLCVFLFVILCYSLKFARNFFLNFTV